jgi:aryl-alcohol dehydrogenase-like predicted oxidoreductase
MKFSKIQLGTVQFGLRYGVANTEGKPSYEKARDIIAAASENGINTLDTAAAYGDSEKILGRALTELNLQDKVQIISKVPPVGRQNLSSAEEFINKSVEDSLRRLRRDYLDVCLFHCEDDLKYLDVLRKLKSRGLIKDCGMSLDSTEYCAEALEQDIKFIQLPYNILDKRFDKFLSNASVRNIKVFTRSLYLQGLLLMDEDRVKSSLREMLPVRRKLEQLADSAGMSMIELCARFVLNNQAITSILTGVDNLTQLQENIKLIEKGPLADDLYSRIREAVPNFPEEIIRPAKWQK